MDIQSVISAINVDLAKVTADRLFGYDPTHIYLFKNGFDGLSASGSRATRLSPFMVEALFYKFRQRRIDAALELMSEDMRNTNTGSVEKTAAGYIVRERGEASELTKAQFVMLARERGYLAKDDPFFCVDSYDLLGGWDGE